DVYLKAAPQVHIRDVKTQARFIPQGEDAVLEVQLTVRNYADAGQARNHQVGLQLLDEGRQPVAAEIRQRIVSVEGGEDVVVQVDIPVSAPRRWSAEEPNLYALLLTLEDEEGHVLETGSVFVGFREIRIERGQLLINGKPVILKGVNRNEFHPDLGFVTPVESML
ncbi:glycoside hydrolase family 2 TIM barrel-domain containing protein, partial [Paenibacillus sp. y28]|uniref:glycoside hydrolase family 2 TIM barrel-domain containing protein n=1 Tax=Paenibacillus sp. y28 TaxID=3129110 RepID=UPI003017169F